MRILVVDDEVVSRKKMEKIMSSLGSCQSVDGGPAALNAYRAALEEGDPFDLISLDVSMPLMDGTQVLYEIRKIEQEQGLQKAKQARVMMVTAQADKDTVVTCIQAGCDTYVLKPFNKETIIEKLHRLGIRISIEAEEDKSIREMVMATVANLKQKKLALPVLPHIVKEVEEALQDPSTNIDQLAAIIENDAVISLKLITIANSTIYRRGPDKVQHVRAAIPRIGLRETKSVVSTIANKGLYETSNKVLKSLLEKLWIHSLTCAHCARTISQELGGVDDQKVFLMGLLHDIGIALLLKNLGSAVCEGKEFNRDEMLDSIQEVHTAFGAALLEEWGFEREYVRIAKLHEWASFPKDTERELLIVSLADRLCYRMGYGFFEKGPDLALLEALEALKMDQAKLDEIEEKVRTTLGEAIAAF